MLKFLSKILFFLSSFSILPPRRAWQEKLIEKIESSHLGADEFLKNSLRQYDCQARFFSKGYWILVNLGAVILFFPLFAVLLLRSSKTARPIQKSDISLYPKIPQALFEKFGLQYVKKPIGSFRPRDIPFLRTILLKSGLRPYFIFRAVWKIAIYSELIQRYESSRVWVTQEMVFESSLLSYYLESFGLKHINFMHGDNYFSLQTAFATFSEFYVWDEYYISLFKSMRVTAKRFELFQALDRLTSEVEQRNVLKYYNQVPPNAAWFNLILDNLIKFAETKQCRLVVRLHPLHKKKFEREVLEKRAIAIESNYVDFVDSLSEAKYVCSEFSSVLYQASLLHKKIVIDNTFPERMALIQELDPIFLKKLDHEFLVTSAETSRR